MHCLGISRNFPPLSQPLMGLSFTVPTFYLCPTYHGTPQSLHAVPRRSFGTAEIQTAFAPARSYTLYAFSPGPGASQRLPGGHRRTLQPAFEGKRLAKKERQTGGQRGNRVTFDNSKHALPSSTRGCQADRKKAAALISKSQNDPNQQPSPGRTGKQERPPRSVGANGGDHSTAKKPTAGRL